jgi:hypothetical protein
MKPLAIVPDLYILKDRPSSLRMRRKLPGHTFGFEGAEEAFHRGIVIAGARPRLCCHSMNPSTSCTVMESGFLPSIH